ncbi:unnamed protein product [Pieris brassicae]|uniref:Uncharacterized protein n=1 Tax=Pieris brassicae TaxID=7116 RepID=A0A9P0T8N0_PIEBR|nr:unnamed protein product [Pieris brassicae]
MRRGARRESESSARADAMCRPEAGRRASGVRRNEPDLPQGFSPLPLQLLGHTAVRANCNRTMTSARVHRSRFEDDLYFTQRPLPHHWWGPIFLAA